MWGISAGFVHGVGFVPTNRPARWGLGPLPAWGLCALGYWILARALLG
jgi:predicted membrane protein